MSAVAKGRRNQRRTTKMLEAIGFKCVTARFGRFGPTDFFGLWDCWCVKDDEWLLIQVSTNQRKGLEWREQAGLFVCPAGVKKEEWVWVDYEKEPKIYLI